MANEDSGGFWRLLEVSDLSQDKQQDIRGAPDHEPLSALQDWLSDQTESPEVVFVFRYFCFILLVLCELAADSGEVRLLGSKRSRSSARQAWAPSAGLTVSPAAPRRSCSCSCLEWSRGTERKDRGPDSPPSLLLRSSLLLSTPEATSAFLPPPFPFFPEMPGVSHMWAS